TSSPPAIVSPSWAAASPLSGSTPSPQLSSSGAPASTGSSAGISVTVTLSATGFRSRITLRRTGCPGATAATRRWSSGTSLMGAPLSSTMTSPWRTPAASAGPPFMTSATSTPSRTPKVPASSSVTSWIAMPRRPRRRRFHLEHSEVGLRIATHELRRELPAVREPHGDVLSVLDDVVVRQDVSSRIHQHAGAARPRLLAWAAAEEALVELLAEEL